MKLTKNSWHYNAYSLLTGKTPNNNFCDYFWELLFNLVLFIPNIPFYILTAIFSKYEEGHRTYKAKLKANNQIPIVGKMFVSAGIWFLLTMLVLGLLTSVTKTLLFIIGFIVFNIGIVYFFTKSSTKDKIANNLEETKDMVKEAFYSFKDNYCPKIDWTDKN
jgi:hypothetical protein